MHRHFRDCQAWRDEGLPLSTTSNEAAKMFDASLTQYVSWYDDPQLGGLENTLKKLKEADPSFVMGHVLENGLTCMATGLSAKVDLGFKSYIDSMVTLAEKSNITERERKHVNAVKLWTDGYSNEAAAIWEDILIEHPTDMTAIKMAHDTYFYLGKQAEMRDSIARTLPLWKQNQPLYGYLFGMHSFGLVESNFYSEAEIAAKKGLEFNKNDAWSTHALCHVYEMECRPDEGISFVTRTMNDWTICGMLACHNFWHWAVFYLEKGETNSALNLYDNQVAKRVKSGALLDIVDACSLLFRLEMEGVDVGSRWNDLFEICRPHLEDHILVFNDIHLLMACLGAKKKDVADVFMESIKNYVSNNLSETNKRITHEVGQQMFEAFQAYDEGNFEKAVELFNPIRYRIVEIGGSNAQRDIFNLFLIHSCLKSSNKKHHALARTLLLERKSLRPNSPMTERLIGQSLQKHYLGEGHMI
ncbi:tetratricopeptide repeat protein 38-like [Tubulanus polymorphus]|uniref:tetratricopeptide repeat protein 38-like n=1 Tax=Tubulanus polymorphus TaxID=672921 RepID=UPI003DA1D0DE